MGKTVRGKIVVVHRERANAARVRDIASEANFVADWVEALMRAVEASRIGLPGDAELAELQARLEASVQKCLKVTGDLTLAVDEFDLTFEGHCVYHSSAERESLSVALFRDGVRRITLRRGVDHDELLDFVDLLGKAIGGNDEGWDDAVTLFWDRNFRHIDYLCAPGDDWHLPSSIAVDEWSYSQEADQVPPSTEPPPRADAGRAGRASDEERCNDWLLPTSETPPLADIANEHFDFTSVEAENIRMIALIEDVVPLRERLLELASAMLTAEEEAVGFLECGSIIGLLVERAVGEGNMEEAHRLVSRLRSIAAVKEHAPGEFQEAADRIIRDIAEADFLCRIGQVLSAGRDIDLRALTNFLAQLGPSAAPTLCDLLGEIGDMKFRRAICEALALSCRDNVEVLIERLSDPRWFLVRNILYILGRIAHQGVERALGDALSHSDVRVRREAVSALGGIDSPVARAYLNSALRDSDKSVRIAVAKQLAKTRSERSARIIWGVIESPEFLSREGGERDVFFEALGRVGSDLLVPLAERALVRGEALPSGDQGIRADAALALAWLGTPAALAVLSREVTSRHEPVRRAVMTALEAVRKRVSKS